MCEHGDTELVPVWIPPDQSSTGEWKRTMAPIDRCIAPIVRGLDSAGVLTRGCCCGHGKQEGTIVLYDGRELIIKAKEGEK